jgi:hypothetical protein
VSDCAGWVKTIRSVKHQRVDKVLSEGEPEAAGLLHSAVEELVQELAGVIRRFLRFKDGARQTPHRSPNGTSPGRFGCCRVSVQKILHATDEPSVGTQGGCPAFRDDSIGREGVCHQKHTSLRSVYFE